MEDKVYRYTKLTGAATITRSGKVILVNLHDSHVNPNGKSLKFDHPLDSDPDSNPKKDGDFPKDNIQIVAALNKAWFKFHTETNGFRFKKWDGQNAQKWEDLEKPHVKASVKASAKSSESKSAPMDPVRP
jgi:hypothetical protein